MPFKGPNPPAEPTDFDPNDRYKDPVVYFQHREALLAEHTLKEAEIRVRLTLVMTWFISILEKSRLCLSNFNLPCVFPITANKRRAQKML